MGIIKNSLHKFPLQQVDTDVFLWVQRRFCQKASMPFVRVISMSGDGWLYPLIAIVAISFNFALGMNFFYSCLLTYALEVPLYVLLKRKFKRHRPQDFLTTFEARIKPSDQFSFPSGHTAAAFVMATQLLIFFPLFTPLALLWALSIGTSRVLLGVHFPGDILAGATLGVLCALLSNELLSVLNVI